MSKSVILTGLRANNDLHLGNYLGALLPMVDMAKELSGSYQINLFVPDLHSFTTPIDHNKLQQGIMKALRVFVTAGLPIDSANVNVYRQSYIPAHSELTWILDCFTGMGEMNRMTQFKDKSGSAAILSELGGKITGLTEMTHAMQAQADPTFHTELTAEYLRQSADFFERFADMMDREASVSVGLLNYPVLMTADILLYGASYIPVGEDQTQHLEFARDIATRMNNRFGDLFVVPESVQKQHEFFGKDQGLRIKDLVDPSKKMSKSDETGKGVIFLTDTREIALKKIMSATTDSVGQINYDKVNQPGLANLIDILALLEGRKPEEVASDFAGQTQYGAFKAAVAEKVGSFLEDFQIRLLEVNDQDILRKLEDSEKAMNAQANETLLRVQKAVGLR